MSGSVVLLSLAGTRPELLKLVPVVQAIARRRSRIEVKLCLSGQHDELIDSVLGELQIAPDIDLRAPVENRSLSSALALLLERIDSVVAAGSFSGIIVQGDTNTTLAGALVAFHRQLPSFHVEAGLRTKNPLRPFPEEMNRRLVSRMAALHFAPTPRARDHLLLEGIEPERIHLTGNTIVDALSSFTGTLGAPSPHLSRLSAGKRLVLVTFHRRENIPNAEAVARAVHAVVRDHPDVEVAWILHLNAVRPIVEQALSNAERVHLLPPLSYGAFLTLMSRATFVLTDSGGVQEEAPSFGVPVLVLRDETERPEAVEAGSSRLVPAAQREIEAACRELLNDSALHAAMSLRSSPFGDGRSSERIVDALIRYYA